jgi:hypothetical protein
MIKNGWTQEIKKLKEDRDDLLTICRAILDSKILLSMDIGEDYQRLVESAVIRIGGHL